MGNRNAIRTASWVVLAGGLSVWGMAQTVNEFSIPNPAARPQCMTPGPDGSVWVSERNNSKIGRVAPNGTVVEFTASGLAGTTTLRQQCVTHGPDGNLWFTVTETVEGQIGKITPSGAVTVFPTLVTTSRFYSITAGSDGALWFTEAGSVSKIGRMTTAGALTEYPTPSPGGFFNIEGSITAGPDGSLWFTEPMANKIGRLDPTRLTGCEATPTNCMTEFAIPTAGSGPAGIATGPDGALWFVEKTSNKIGRITTAGVVTNEFSITTASAGANDITAGPDGNLWFTEQTANKIGKMTTSGALTEISVPTASSQPEGIAKGPDGNIWFGEYTGSKIGRISVGGGGGSPSPTPTATLSVTPTRTPTGMSSGSARSRVTPIYPPTPKSNVDGRT